MTTYLGEIVKTAKKVNCGYCKKIILKNRDRMDIVTPRGYSYPDTFHYHLDCHIVIMNKELDIIKNHIKDIKLKITKEYLEQKEKDILIEAL